MNVLHVRRIARSVGLLICAIAVAIVFQVQSRSGESDRKPAPVADAMVGKQAGQVRDDNFLKMKLVWCPPGFVTMESVEVVTTETNEGTEPKAAADDDVVEAGVHRQRRSEAR